MSARTPKFDPENVPFLALPWVLFSQRKTLPQCAAVYFICDGNAKVLYIGQSINIRQRWTIHDRIPQCAELFYCRIAWLEVDDHTLLTLIEDACIEYFQPPWNGNWPSYLTEARRTIKISTEALSALRILAAYEGQRQHHVVEQLIFEALRRTERQRDQKGHPYGPPDA